MAETVLVVDDSKELRTVLGMQLKRQGYKVELAIDGEDGLRRAQELKPQIIIMDIMMPKMDGFTAAQKMRENQDLKHTPIILLSALGGEEDIIKGIECGADDYLIKPFKAPELSAKIKMLIRKSSGFTNRPDDETVQTEKEVDKSVRRFKETGQVLSKEFAGFQIVDKLGQGGSGVVYRAIEPMHLTPLALKVVSPFVSQSPRFIERFTRSSEISIKLRHPHIVRCFTIGEYQGVHFMTQELIEGLTLDLELERHGPFDELRAFRLMQQLIDAFVYLEEQGYIHRDVKPSNIFITKDEDAQEVAKLADFGLSKLSQDLSQTVEGHVLGTPHYLSPEQARGDKNIDPRGDLYSLAATFYHLLTGEPPFDGENLSALVIAHIQQTPVNPQERKPDLSDQGAALIMRFLEKAPDKRCSNMSEALSLVTQHVKELEGGS